MSGEDGDGGDDLFGLGSGADEGLAPMFPAPKRGAGRPAGAANRKTLALKALYHAHGFRDPVLAMGEVVSQDPVALWKYLREAHRLETGSTEGAPSLADVLALQQVARRDLAPFIHGKAPIRIESDDRALPVLILDLGTDQVSGGQRVLAGDRPLSIGVAESEQKQGVGDDAE